MTIATPSNTRAQALRAPSLIPTVSVADDPGVAVLCRAGLRAGMQVLDADCGDSDLTLLVASVVGPQGRVSALAESSSAIRQASLRAARAGVQNLRFVRHEGESFDLDTARPFDALVGRAAFLHLDEPARRLRALVERVSPGGLVLLQESSDGDTLLQPHHPVQETEFDRLGDMVAWPGPERRTALRLSRLFRSVGLPAPQLHISLFGGDGSRAPSLISAWARR